MIVLRRKNFAFFGKTIANFKNMTGAFKAGNYGQAAKSGAAALGRGTLGVAKGAAGATLAAGAVGGLGFLGASGSALSGNMGDN